MGISISFVMSLPEASLDEEDELGSGPSERGDVGYPKTEESTWLGVSSGNVREWGKCLTG